MCRLLIPENGIFSRENPATERFVDAEVSEFAVILVPVPIKGATGSPGAARAVRSAFGAKLRGPFKRGAAELSRVDGA